MTNSFWELVWALFDAIADLGPDERERALEEADPRVAAQVPRLLEAHDDEQGLLRETALEDLRQAGAPPTVASLPDLTGRVIADRYSLDREIGRGGAGIVFSATDRVRARRVAIKVLPPARRSERRRARVETAMLRLLRVAGVVRLLDDGRTAKTPIVEYVVTERIDGKPFPGCATPCTWQEIAYTVRSLLETVDRIHWAGIVHRDLKPGNVLVRADGTAVVLDLGIAQRMVDAQAEMGSRAGTLRYLAPETLKHGRVSVRSDLYAIGVMLYEALSGSLQRDGAARRPIQNAPRRVRDVVEQCLARDPGARPASASEVLQALAEDGRGPNPSIRGPIPNSAVECRSLFAGHSRLHHLPEDAADELWRRCAGDGSRAIQELDAWQRAGLGRWEGERFEIGRRGVEALVAGLRVAPVPVETTAGGPALPAGALRLLVAVELAGRRATAELLAQSLDVPTSEIGSRLDALEQCGCLLRTADGAYRVERFPAGSRAFLEAEGRAIHRRLARALPVGDEGRLYHFAAAGEFDLVAREATGVARTLIAIGSVARARVVLAEGLRAVEAHPDAEAESQLLVLSLQAALQMGSGGAYDHFLYQLGTRWRSESVGRMERIVRGVLRAIDGQTEHALSEIPDPAEAGTDLERRCTASARLFAGRGLDNGEFLRLVAETERLAQAVGSDGLHAIAANERAWLRYRQGAFAEAAVLHVSAAELASTVTTRTSAQLNGASAYLEAGAFDRAEDQAFEARAVAVTHRHAVNEARAERVLRAAAYRRGDEGLRPDPCLVEASRTLGQPNLAGMIALNEAAIAWRTGRLPMAASLAHVAAQEWAGRECDQATLARALAAAAGAPLAREDCHALLRDIDECEEPTFAVQAAGLLSRTCAKLAEICRPLIARRSEEIDLDDPDQRLEVLSITEARKSPPA